jgi:hypothetical protein
MAVTEPLKVGDPIVILLGAVHTVVRARAAVVTWLGDPSFGWKSDAVVGKELLSDEGRLWVRGHGVETAQALKAAWMLQRRP